MTDRRALYKNADRDFAASRRNRQDHSVEIRKVKKEDNLQKRRNIALDDLSDASPVKENIKPVNILSNADICKMMKSKIIAEKIDAVTACRKKLSKEHNPPIEEFCKKGAVATLVKILESNKEDILIFEASWALTNIASGDSKHTAAVVDAGAIKLFIAQMSHTSEQVCEQSVWALGNIVGDGTKFRNLSIKAGLVPAVVKCLRRFWNDAKIILNLIWLISNICRHKGDNYPTDEIISLLPIIRELMIAFKDNSTAQSDISWALSYATDADQSVIEAVISNNILPIINSNFNGTTEVLIPSIRAMGNVVASEDLYTNAAIESGVVQSMAPLLEHTNNRIVKEACWLLSNISAGTPEQVTYLVDSGIIKQVLKVLLDGDYKSQKEAVWVLSNICTSKDDKPKLYLLNNSIFGSLVKLLSCDDQKIVLLLLDIVKALFEVVDSYNQLDECLKLLEEVGGIDVIEHLQQHESEEVYQASYDLVQKYFDYGEEEEEQQNEDAEKFAF